ncbi:cyclase family protein [Pseudolysinimonas yzui]|uniref:Cyclase family protein n=1 Tax=Pseudolysinimonas yzui TaxID=2708254 RepID=A0A8J3GT23_9MICO|nr:cyclase family protein [Pseudolysinimonas yzui]GHF27421.1 hypothetical protein GCM10011600_30330 [Pseudolysinimonas yzui]
MPRPSQVLLSAEEFAELAARLADVDPGLTDPPAGIAAVRAGRVVSLGDPPAHPALAADVQAAPHAPSPYRLHQWADHGPGWVATNDRLDLDIHGAPSMTHLDSTSHFEWPESPVPAGSRGGSLASLASSGVVGRGVLIDVPGVLGPLAPGDVVTHADLIATLDRTGTDVRPGDALYLRFGREGIARSDVPLGSSPTSGLSIDCAEWLAGARPSLVATDEGLDSAPSEVAGQPTPWHLLLLTVLGVPLVDRARLGELSDECAAAGRWEFLSVIAPLPIPDASGSPVNPLAIL